jgi:hypothetical protein
LYRGAGTLDPEPTNTTALWPTAEKLHSPRVKIKNSPIIENERWPYARCATSLHTSSGGRFSRLATYSISSVTTPLRANYICEKFLPLPFIAAARFSIQASRVSLRDPRIQSHISISRTARIVASLSETSDESAKGFLNLIKAALKLCIRDNDYVQKG